MLKKIVTTLLLLSPLWAQECEEMTSKWSFAGEWLYFMPSMDQSEWIWDGPSQLAAGNFESARRGELQQYYSAFRVEGKYLFCPDSLALTVRYTNFSQNYFQGIDAQNASPIFGLCSETQQASNRNDTTFNRDYHYYNIEGLLGLQLPSYCRLSTLLSFGVKFVHLHIDETARFIEAGTATPVNHIMNENMRSWAVGPALSIDGFYPIWRCFDLTGRFLFGYLACESATQLTQQGGSLAPENGLTALITNDPKLWHVIPSAQMRLGLNYCNRLALWCCKFGLDVEGGYELLREGRIVNRITTTEDPLTSGALTLSFDSWSDFTLNGPYIRVNLSY